MRTITVNNEFPMRKLVIAMMGVGVLAIFLTSFAMGVDVPASREHAGAKTKDSEMMSSVAPLMAKLKDNPNDKEAVSQLAHIFNEAEEWEKAEPFWGKLVAMDPTNMGTRYHRGFALAQLSRFPEAIAEYEAILKVKPGDSIAHFYLGLINKHGLKKMDLAKKHLQQAKAATTDDPELLKEIEKELADMK